MGQLYFASVRWKVQCVTSVASESSPWAECCRRSSQTCRGIPLLRGWQAAVHWVAPVAGRTCHGRRRTPTHSTPSAWRWPVPGRAPPALGCRAQTHLHHHEILWTAKSSGMFWIVPRTGSQVAKSQSQWSNDVLVNDRCLKSYVLIDGYSAERYKWLQKVLLRQDR